MIKKIISLFLISAMLAALASCGNSNTENAGSNAEPSASEAETSAQETTTAEIKPDIPDADMEGRTFTFLTSSWGSYSPLDFVDIAPEDMDGEVLNDAAYNRNIKIQPQYNCTVAQYNVNSDAEVLSTLSKAVAAGDSDYDIVFMRGRNVTSAITSGYLLALDNLPYNDFTMPWWNKNSYESLAISGKHYVTCGDVSSNEMMAVWNVCFNKGMIENFSLDSPYELVKSGKWTFDKSIEMSKAVAGDLNGDGIMDGNDRWGINHTSDTVIGILNACDINIAQTNKQGVPEVTIDSEKSVSRAIDILNKLFNETYAMDTLSRNTMKSVDSDADYFNRGNILFIYTASHLIWQMRQSDVEFGIVPYPKYDETQKDYKPSTAGIFLSILTVPITVKDVENTSIFLEAYAYEGYKTVKPAYYDVILQGKFARDNESAEIIDYIYGNISYDIGNIYNFGDMASKVGGLSSTLNTDFSSFVASNLNVLQSGIDDVMKAMK